MLEILQGPHGPGLRYRGETLHHPDHPREEARVLTGRVDTADKRCILVFGVGLGYHLHALAENSPQAKLAAFDPDPKLLALYTEDDRFDNRLTLTSDWNAFNDLLTREVVHGESPDPAVFIHPAYQKLFPEEARMFDEIVHGARIRRAVNDKTIKEKGRLFLDNFSANLPALLERPALTDLNGDFQDRPGFIIGSGPSLEKNLSRLTELRGRGLILAAGSAWKPLVESGIRPDMVVVIEAEDTSQYLAGAHQDTGALLALASAVHPNHFRVSGFRQASYHLSPGPAYLLGNDDFVPQAGTSGSAAFTIGYLLGLNPLVLLGQDQAFISESMHTPGTPGEVPLTDVGPGLTVPGTDGDRVMTHSGFAASLHWYAESAKFLRHSSPDRVVINSSDPGAHIPGVPDLPLAQVLKSLPLLMKEFDLPQKVSRLSLPDPAVVRKRLKESWEIVSRVSLLLRMAPDNGYQTLEDCRSGHPFLGWALAGLEMNAPIGDNRGKIEEIENHLLMMMAHLDDRDGK